MSKNSEPPAEFEIGNQTYSLQIDKIFPEVSDGRFEAEMIFIGQAPPELGRGMTLRPRLGLGRQEERLLLTGGGFYSRTGGAWVFVMAEDRQAAVRRDIRIGRQNSEYFEVLEGLQPGEQVVISSYEAFGDAKVLSF